MQECIQDRRFGRSSCLPGTGGIVGNAQTDEKWDEMGCFPQKTNVYNAFLACLGVLFHPRTVCIILSNSLSPWNLSLCRLRGIDRSNTNLFQFRLKFELHECGRVCYKLFSFAFLRSIIQRPPNSYTLTNARGNLGGDSIFNWMQMLLMKFF